METVRLNNGVEMPILGYGVYQVTPEECERCVLDAISVGYRSIDTAQAYYNEEGVGNAVRKCGVPREELFITTKVWISNGTYRAMEEAYKAGKARAIGVSNFYPDRFIDLAEFCEIKPAVNQVETHVFNQQVKPQEIMKKYDTKVMSWGPFAEGRNNFFSNEVLKAIGEQYGKSVAQVALRFLIQRDIIVIPKSTRKERMIENFDVFDFTLSVKDMEEIAGLDKKESLFFSHYDPEMVNFLINL